MRWSAVRIRSPAPYFAGVSVCRSYLSDHPGARVTDAIKALWDSFGLDRDDVLAPPQDLLSLWMLTFTKALRFTKYLAPPQTT